MYWRPDPNRPPPNNRNGSAMRGRAPASLSSTMPLRTRTTRVAGLCDKRLVLPLRGEFREEVGAGRRLFGHAFVASVAIDADGRTADENCGNPPNALQGCDECLRGVHPTVPQFALIRGRPASVDRCANKIDDGIGAVEGVSPFRGCGTVGVPSHLLGLPGAARQHGDRHTITRQVADERRAEQACPASDNDAHRAMVSWPERRS